MHLTMLYFFRYDRTTYNTIEKRPNPNLPRDQCAENSETLETIAKITQMLWKANVAHSTHVA